MNPYTNLYQNNQIRTASPEQILIMLYDGAIRFNRQAMQAMETGNKGLQGEKIGRTLAIISEFANTLDHEIGGQIATDLDSLYNFMIHELTRANIEEDREALETVDSLLTDLRESWVEAAKIYGLEKQAPITSGTGIAAAL